MRVRRNLEPSEAGRAATSYLSIACGCWLIKLLLEKIRGNP